MSLLIGNSLPLTLVLFVAVLAVVGIIVNIALQQTKKSSKNAILFTGLPFAGKTAIFYKIAHNKTVETVTSIKENEANVALSEGQSAVHLIDIPGHERLRFKFSEFMPIARAAVFVVDSSTVGRQTRLIAEYLYDILANKFTQTERIPILIACNKSDLLTAFKKERVQELIEVEINKLRQTRSAALDTTESDENDNVYLGFEGQDFKFLDLENEIEFVECSVENNAVENVKDWIENLRA